MKHICLIHRILNERKTSYLHQDCLYLYKNKEIYMYWVLFVVLLDLRQGLIVLKSSLLSIIWQFVGHGVNIFVWGVLRGVMACGGDGTLWGCDPRVGDELATMQTMGTQDTRRDILMEHTGVIIRGRRRTEL